MLRDMKRQDMSQKTKIIDNYFYESLILVSYMLGFVPNLDTLDRIAQWLR